MRILLAQLLLLATATFGQTLKVHVIDAKKARPAKGVSVQIALNGGPGYESFKPVPNSSRTAITDSSGDAVFNINPQPEQYVIVAFSEQCATGKASFSLQEISTSGLVPDSHCYHKIRFNNLKAQPGEILLFRDQLNLFERMAHVRDAQ
jgi:hypothetical protein